jgi:hypothetical protein
MSKQEGPSSSPFRLRSLLEPHEEGQTFPPTVRLWGWAVSTALVTGMVSGVLRGARLGYARGMAACKMQGITGERVRPFVRSFMQAEMARGGLVQGGRLGAFVACFLGADVVALQYHQIAGPAAPAIGGALAAGVVTARRGAVALSGAVLLGGLMGLAFGVVRSGFGESYTAAIERLFAEKETEKD